MRDQNKHPTLRGFMLLPPSQVPGYQGVDRNPFQPSLVEEEIDHSIQKQEGGLHIWSFYRPGWRQEAYRLFEENAVKGNRELLLLSSKDVAREIQLIIEPHLGPHEIIACEVWKLDQILSFDVNTREATFLGYDVAYPGGDFYSAILNGLIINPHPELLAEYQLLLNHSGLFSSTKIIPAYVHRFKELVPSEANSEFCIYRLSIA